MIFFARSRAALALTCAALALSACEEVPESGQPSVAPAPRGEGMSAPQAEATVAQIFAANGCKMTLARYMDHLDEAGYDPALHDVTTPEGHLTMVNRVILESTPMLLAENGQFKRSGSTLTSKIGGCA